MAAKTAVFDIIGTCFSLERPRRALGDLGAPPLAFDVWFATALRDYFAMSHAGGYIPLKDVLQADLERALFEAGVEAPPNRVQEVLAEFAQLDPQPRLREAVEHLAGQGWKLIALTNGAAESTEKLLERAEVRRQFGEVLSCDAIQVSKPNRAVYQMALDRADGEAWMVAAHAWDIAGAARSGMRTVFVAADERSYPASVFPRPDAVVAGLPEAAQRMTGS